MRLLILSFLVSMSAQGVASELYCVASHPSSQVKFFASAASSVPVEQAVEQCKSWAKTEEADAGLCQLDFCDQLVDLAEVKNNR